jgi:DNA repair protein RadC
MIAILKRAQAIDQTKEHFYVIGLRTNNVVQFIDLVSMGSLNGTVVCGREVFKAAIIKSVASIILVHNHPSGNKSASKSDIEITNKMIQAGKYLDIKVLDHIIVTTDSGYYSFADEGLL